MFPPIHLRCLISLLIWQCPKHLSILIDVFLYYAPLCHHLGMPEHAFFCTCYHFRVPRHFYPPWSLVLSFETVTLWCWFFFDVRKHLGPPIKSKVMDESSPYLFVWIHFYHVLSYVVVFLCPFTMFILPYPMETARPPSPCLFILMCFVVVLHCAIIWEFLGAHVFGCAVISPFLGVNCECDWWLQCGRAQQISRGND